MGPLAVVLGAMCEVPMSVQARELHDLRVGQFMRAVYEAAAANREVLRKRAPEDVSKWDKTSTRPGRCLCCGERKEIPIHWHVCLGCHIELEAER